MPSSVPALFVFVSLALPGLAFHLVRNQRRLPGERSVLLETASLVAVGFTANLVGIATMVVTHSLASSLAPDLKFLVLGGEHYLEENFSLIATWWIIGLSIATGFSSWLGLGKLLNLKPLQSLRGQLLGNPRGRSPSTPIPYERVPSGASVL